MSWSPAISGLGTWGPSCSILYSSFGGVAPVGSGLIVTSARVPLPSPHTPTISSSVVCGEPTGREKNTSLADQSRLPVFGSMPWMPPPHVVMTSCSGPPLGFQSVGVDMAAFLVLLRSSFHFDSPVLRSNASSALPGDSWSLFRMTSSPTTIGDEPLPWLLSNRPSDRRQRSLPSCETASSVYSSGVVNAQYTPSSSAAGVAEAKLLSRCFL